MARKKLESKIPNSRNKVSRKLELRIPNSRSKASRKAKPKYSKKDFDKLKKWYESELEEKDKLIKQLHEENVILLSTALKQGAKTREIFEKAKKSIFGKK